MIQTYKNSANINDKNLVCDDLSKNFYLDQCREMGLTPDEAAKMGILPHPMGVKFTYYQTASNPYWYVPKYNKEKFRAWQNTGKTWTENSPSPFHITYGNIRLRPDIIARNIIEDPKNKGKSRLPSKEERGFNFMPLYCNFFMFPTFGPNETFVITEGEKKAIALEKLGIPTAAAPGISNMRLNDPNYISKLQSRSPGHLIAMYDPDALDWKQKNAIISATRHKQFASSGIKFAKDVFDFNKKHRKKIKPVLCIVKNKKIDDLINDPETDKAAIQKGICEMKTNNHFIFIHLNAKTYKKTINNLYGITSPEEFYQRNKDKFDHVHTFNFSGFVCRINEYNFRGDNLLSKRGESYLTIDNDPFKIEIKDNYTQLEMKKYLSEIQPQIDDILSQHNDIYIDSKTNSGKTYLFVQKAKQGQKMVVFLPHKTQVESFYREYGGQALFGDVAGYDHRENLIWATWDKVKFIHDLDQRLVVMDEAHLLVSQYQFRPDAINQLLREIKTAPKRIYLSGTPNLGFIMAYNIHYVKCMQREGNLVSTYHITADANSKQAFARKIIEIIQTKNTKPGQCLDFVVYDDTEALINVKKALIESGFDSDSISIISRKTVDEGDDLTYKNIIRRNTMGNKQIVLSTRILSEGINIYDEVNARVIVIDKDPEKAIQTANRFRHVENIDLILLTAPDNEIKKEYGFNANKKSFKKDSEDEAETIKGTWDIIEAKINIAKAEFSLLELEIGEVKNDFHEYSLFIDTTLAEYTEEIINDNNSIKTSLKNYNYIFIDDLGQPQIDLIKILAEEKTRQINTSPNIGYITQIVSHPMVAYKGNFKIDHEIESEIKPISTKEIKDKSIVDLNKDPETILGALKLHYTETGNIHGLNDISFYYDLKEITPKAKEYFDRNKTYFSFKQFKKGLRQYIKLMWFGYDSDSAINLINNLSATKIDFLFEQYFHISRLQQFRNKYQKLKMSAISRMEAKFEIQAQKLFIEYISKNGNEVDIKKFKKVFDKALQGGRFTILDKDNKEFYIKSNLDYLTPDQERKLKLQRALINWKEDKIIDLLKLYFDIEIDSYSRTKIIHFKKEATNPFQHLQRGNSLNEFAKYYNHIAKRN